MVKSLITGIDISHQSIRAVVLKPRKDTFTLVSYHQMPVEVDIFTDNHRLNYQKIVKKLKELRKALPLFSRKVCLSVPDNSVISKQLQIDSDLSDEECQYVIAQIFARQTPVAVEKLYIDFVALAGEQTQVKANYHVYAVRKECVDARIAPFLQSGFKPILVNPYSHNLAQLLRHITRSSGESKWMLMNFNLDHVAVCVETEKQGFVYKELPLNGSEIAVEKLFERLLMTINLLDLEPEGVWLSGEKALLGAFAALLSSTLGLACVVLELYDLFDCQQRKAEREFGSQYAIALGLALSGLGCMEKGHAA
ncbi:type IV pilus assembly protein PilM [Vibrio neptunius]|uniref:type IV pilus assembly protein PilM n=1 Tax=Vibrio neptunius TaxID=170651 RepID=UPI003314D67A